MSGQRIVEGIFAINKPPLKTSAQVLRELQAIFNASAFFGPWLDAARASRARENRTQQRRRRKHARLDVKMGHGGTLDPMATGVLIVGVGRGTKALGGFLGCTKTYEAGVLFGAASDTYDVTGRLLGRAGTDGATREAVEEALARDFKGDIMQRPPIYSALRVQGKRLYEYAREGKEPPVDIKERPVTVEEARVVEWLAPGEHGFKLPREEVEKEEREVVEKIVDLGDGSAEELGQKRKRSPGEEESPVKKIAKEDGDANIQGSEPAASPKGDHEQDAKKAESPEQPADQATDGAPLPAPAEDGPGDMVPGAKISITSSSGFYVRSLCHDLGRAVGSLGMMASLVRTRQGQFELGKNVLEYADFEQSEEMWGPKLEAMLTEWTAEQEKQDK